MNKRQHKKQLPQRITCQNHRIPNQKRKFKYFNIPSTGNIPENDTRK